MIDRRAAQSLHRLRRTTATSFQELVGVAGLNPAEDFRGVDLRDVDFGTADLNAFDFTESDLSGADFRYADYRNAIFNRTTLEGVRWRLQKEVLRRDSTYQLNLFGQAVVKDVTSFVKEKRRVPSIKLSMPQGSGKTALLEVLLEELDSAKILKNTLLVVDSVAEREQSYERLSQTFGAGSVGVASSRKREPSRSRIEIVTLSALSRWLKSGEESTLNIGPNINCIVTFTSKTASLSTLGNIKKNFKAASLISFEGVWEYSEASPIEYDLDYRYALDKAVDDRTLDVARKIRLAADIELPDVIRNEPIDAHGVVILSNHVELEHFAFKLSQSLFGLGLEWRVIPFGDDFPSRNEPLAGVIYVVKAATATRQDWSAADFVIATTNLSSMLAQALSYPRPRFSRVHEPIIYQLAGSATD